MDGPGECWVGRSVGWSEGCLHLLRCFGSWSFELLFGLVALRFWPDLNENVDGMAIGDVERPVTGESAIKEKKTT